MGFSCKRVTAAALVLGVVSLGLAYGLHRWGDAFPEGYFDLQVTEDEAARSTVRTEDVVHWASLVSGGAAVLFGVIGMFLRRRLPPDRRRAPTLGLVAAAGFVLSTTYFVVAWIIEKMVEH